MLQATATRVHDGIAARPRAVLLGAALAGAAAAGLLPRAGIDVSFRPLFADDPAGRAASAAFAAEFGDGGAAWIAVVAEPRTGAVDDAFLARTAAAAGALAALPDLAEVRPPGAPGTVSGDGRYALLLARPAADPTDLATRTRAVEALRRLLSDELGPAARLHYAGVPVVEAAYAGIVLRSMATGLVVCLAAICGLLWLLYGPGGVLTGLAGTAAATPLALAALVAGGQQITLVNSMVPTVILVIGVADAVHMLQAWLAARSGLPPAAATRRMVGEMALPCLLTTATTACGFLALQTARVDAIRDFGVNVAVGVAAVWLMNMLLVPALLHALPPALLPRPRAAPGRAIRRWSVHTSRSVRRRGPAIVACGLAASALMLLALPRLTVDQRFNEEVAPGHPVRAAQALLEAEFTGFLGPELVIARADGSALGDGDADVVAAAGVALAALPDVTAVIGPLPGNGTRAALLVRTGDIGTGRALPLAAAVRATAAAALGAGYSVDMVGDWWLAQRGMAAMLGDMLRSVSLSALLILPLLVLVTRRGRLLGAAVLPNLLPLLVALAFMAAAGIAVRVGTAMILAVALAIGVDDTIHMLARLAAAEAEGRTGRAAVRRAMGSAATGVLITTAVLVIGFLGMALTPLLALRDMALVAAAALLAAFLADCYVLPASCLVLPRLRMRGRVPTSDPRSREAARRPTLVTDSAGLATSREETWV